MTEGHRLPNGTTLAATAALLVALTGLVVWVSETLGDPSRSEQLSGNDFGTTFRGTLGLILVLASLSELTFGLAAIRQARWAWGFGILAQAGIAMASLVRIDPYYGRLPYDLYFRVGVVLIALITLIYLLRPSVRRSFERNSPPSQSDSARPPASSNLGLATALAIILGVIGFFGGLVGMPLMQLGRASQATSTWPDFTLPVILIAGSAIDLLFGVAALQRARWAWALGLLAQVALAAVMFVFPVIGSCFKLIALIPVVTLLYLISPQGRHDFGVDGHVQSTR